MKFFQIIITAIFLFAGFNATAQPLKAGTESTYKASNEGWLVNIQEANVLSSKTGKPIMANFTGSDWCGWCKKLKREVFVTPEFKKWAKENVILLECDYPRSFQLPSDIAQQNSQLQQALGIQGYPTICFITLTNNYQGQISINQIGRMGYVAGGPTPWINEANKFVTK